MLADSPPGLRRPALAVLLLKCRNLCQSQLMNLVQVLSLLVCQDVILQSVLDPVQVRAQRCLLRTLLIPPP